MQRHRQFPIPYGPSKRAILLRTFNSHSAIGNRQSAFSFIEVLFAVILLGIGFIMIAGIFPVAIQQTAAVSNETQGTLVIQDAIRKIQAAADATVATPNTTNNLFPVTGTLTAPIVAPFSSVAATNLMAAIGNDGLYSADPRFGWVGFYRRDSVTSPFAQVFIIALQNTNFPKYLTTTATPAPVPPPIPPNLYGTTPPTVATIGATFTYNTTTSVTQVALTNAPNATSNAFVLVAAAGTGPNPAPAGMIGRIFRLGINLSPGPGTQVFDLQPGADVTSVDVATLTGTSFSANVFIIGAAPTPDASGGFTGPYTGPNQDIAAASAFIRVNLSNN
jgi:type II secretory pathway pseudopilin PulG